MESCCASHMFGLADTVSVGWGCIFSFLLRWIIVTVREVVIIQGSMLVVKWGQKE